MRLALDVLDGQNFDRKHHHGVGPRRAGAAELPAVDALDSDGSFFPLEIILAQIGLGRLVFYHSPWSGCPESMRQALDILEGQNFARKNHHRVGPRCARAAQLAAVDALDRDRQFVALGQRLEGGSVA